MAERVRKVSRQALVLALVTLASNAVQWQTTRVKASSRDDALMRAFSTSVDALSAAQQVVEQMRARVEHLERTCALKSSRSRQGGTASPDPGSETRSGEVFALREDENVKGTGEFLERNPLGFLTDRPSTAVLDKIARENGWK